jgi:kojibiose phosphorylase
VTAIVTSRDGLRGPLGRHAARMAGDALARGFDALRRDQRAAWRRKWRDADVAIDGDPILNNALRFSIYHLIQANAEDDPRVAIGAKALSGLGYRGHFFWDTEVFMLPMFIFTNPPAARNLVAYRWHSLGGARAKAREYGYRGAMFPWEGTLDGSEQCPRWVGPGRVWCGEKQHHVVADVAWGAWSYYQATNDVDFMLDLGLELLVECARFWASRPRLKPKTGEYEIRDIIGPDEYHVGVDNNAYTNYLAAWTLRIADRALAALGRRAKAAEVAQRLRLRKDERPRWRQIARRLRFGYNERTGLIMQHDGFADLRDVPRNRKRPRGERPVLKQADVLMLMRMFPHNFPRRAVKANWDYYEPLTDHGSSLSRGVHAVVAADLGMTRKALDYFADACQLDLIDRNGNTGDGVHAAALGNAWLGAVRGFGGLVVDDDGALSIDPALPARWRGLRYRIHYRGGVLSVDIGRRRISLRYDHPDGNRLDMRCQRRKLSLKSGEDRTVALRR